MKQRLKRLGKILERLPSPYAVIIDDIEADLSNYVSSCTILGGTRFFNLVWDAYRQGGWPCGWEGIYPGGLLIVFEPPLLK